MKQRLKFVRTLIKRTRERTFLADDIRGLTDAMAPFLDFDLGRQPVVTHLNPAERKAYLEACQLLRQVQHAIEPLGALDPEDGEAATYFGKKNAERRKAMKAAAGAPAKKPDIYQQGTLY